MWEEKQHQCKKNGNTNVKISHKTNARRTITPTWEEHGTQVQQKIVIATQEEHATRAWEK
jgi:hypothetical protein